MPKTLTPAEIEAFRERLCEVAEQLFARHGPDGVTLRQLADALGVSSMTPYRYFQDKDAILAAVRTRAFNRFAAAMEQAQATAAREGRPNPPGQAYLDFALSNPAAYRMMFDVNQPTVQAYPELIAAMERARATMSVGLRTLASQGRFSGDIEPASHLFWAAIHGAVMLDLGGLLRPPITARTLAVPMIEALAKHLGMKNGG